MAYTEIKERNRKKYYYRVRSIRKDSKVLKRRIYLGKDLSKDKLLMQEQSADRKLNISKQKVQLGPINKFIPKIKRVLIKNHIKKAGIFGSYVRGEQKKNSDIDILIKPTKNMGFRFFGLQLDLEEALGKRVDLLSYKGIHPGLKQKILREEIRII